MNRVVYEEYRCPLTGSMIRLKLIRRDSDGTRSAETACPAPVPQDCQARAESIAPERPHPTEWR
jgi:hypothetical protein